MMECSYRMSASELRRRLGIKEVKLDIKIPEGLEKKVLEIRRKRVYQP